MNSPCKSNTNHGLLEPPDFLPGIMYQAFYVKIKDDNKFQVFIPGRKYHRHRKQHYPQESHLENFSVTKKERNFKEKTCCTHLIRNLTSTTDPFSSTRENTTSCIEKCNDVANGNFTG